jgi:carboxymethylenebutenolidase
MNQIFPTVRRDRVELPVACGATMNAHVAHPHGPGPHPGVVVAHELFGVTEELRSVVLDRLAAAGFLAIAPELHHRTAGPGLELSRDAEGRDRGFALLHRMTRAGVLADVQAALDHLVARPDTTGRVGLLGLSLGGHAAYLAATQLDVAATAVLYGGWLASTDIPLSRPEPTLALTPGIRGRVLYVVGEDDALVGPADRDAIAEALRAAGVRHDLVVLAEAQHAFVWPGTPAFHPVAAETAWGHVVRLFDEELRAPGSPDSRSSRR